MSKKKMLEEAQIRRMFQLAGIPAIGEGFIGGKYAELANEEQEVQEEAEGEELEEAKKCPHCDGDAPKSECICGKNEGMKYSREEEEEEIDEGSCGAKYSREEDEEMSEGGMKYSREEEGEEESPLDDLGGEEAPAAEEPVADAGMDLPKDKVEAIVDAVLAGIEKETGVPLERVPEAGAEEPAAEEPAPEMDDMDDMGGEADEEEDLAMEQTSNLSDAVLEEISRRVARKLIKLTKNK